MAISCFYMDMFKMDNRDVLPKSNKWAAQVQHITECAVQEHQVCCQRATDGLPKCNIWAVQEQ